MLIRLGERGRVYALFAIVALACALGSLSQTATNSMLESVRFDFGIEVSTGQWLTTIYMLTMGITVPVVTFLSRRLSARSLVFLALGFFLAGALVSLVSLWFAMLVIGRVLQAIAAGITLPFLQSIAMTRFPAGQNGTAMGIAGIAMGFAPNSGPLIGGVFADTWGWRSFFILSLAITILLICAALLLIGREKAPARDASLDVVSLLLSTLGFGGVLLSFSNAASMSIENPLVWVPLIVGAAGIVLFVLRQQRVERPLINLRIFSSRHFRVSFVAQDLLFASFMGITLVVPLYVQDLCGHSAVEAGLVFLPTMIIALVVNPVAGILVDRIGARKVVVCASICLVVGAVSMSFVDAQTPLWQLACMQAVRGLGVSGLIGPLASWGLSGVPRDIVVDASAFFVTVRQACASFGTAAMVFIITAVSTGAFLSTNAVASITLGYQLALGLSAVFAVGVLVVALWKVR